MSTNRNTQTATGIASGLDTRKGLLMQPQYTPKTEEIPYGYCQCGCGQQTLISKYNDKRSGAIKGEPAAYCRGHSKDEPLSVRFWGRVLIATPDDCWIRS